MQHIKLCTRQYRSEPFHKLALLKFQFKIFDILHQFTYKLTVATFIDKYFSYPLYTKLINNK